MSIVLIFENKNVEPWRRALQEKLPKTTIEVYPNVKDKEAIKFIICWKPKKDICKQFPNCKVLQSVGASVDHITNSQTIGTKTIVTRIVDDKLSEDMWEFLITIVLSELKNTRRYEIQQSEKVWQQHEYKSIRETTVSILGLGSIGGYAAEKFAELGFKVKGWSTSKKNIPDVISYQEVHELDLFLEDADFLINILPLTDRTQGIINKNTLQKVPKNTFFINVGRGEHVVEEDLLHQLDISMLSGAFLDVFRTEPLQKEHPFWNHPKIKITPHIASLTNIETAIDQIVENYKRLEKNEELLHVVSLKKGY